MRTSDLTDIMKIVSSLITQFSAIEFHRRFGRLCCLHFHGASLETSLPSAYTRESRSPSADLRGLGIEPYLADLEKYGTSVVLPKRP
jgi:hypothetical protein